MTVVDITMPAGQQEGTRSVIGNWLKSVGDYVAIHQPICEISTDKVVVEIAAPASGILKEILKKALDEILDAPHHFVPSGDPAEIADA